MDTEATATKVVDALLAEGLIPAESRDRSHDVVRLTLGAPASGGRISKLVEVVAYVGAALVLAAGGLFLAQTWNDLGERGQVGALVVVALILAGAGAVARMADADSGVVRRLAGTLFTGAALAVGFAVGLAVELGDHDWNDVYVPGVAGAIAVVVAASIGYALAPTAVGQVGILGGALFATVDLSLASDGEEGRWAGLTILAVGLLWWALAESGLLRERTVGRSLAVSAAVFGAQFVTLAADDDNLGYALTIGVVALAVLVYLARPDWPFLTAAVIGVTLVVPEAVNDWTDGSLGAVGGVLVAGVALLVAAFGGYRLREEATE